MVDLLLSTAIVKTFLLYFNNTQFYFLINRFKKKKKRICLQRNVEQMSVVDENLNEVKASTSNKQSSPTSQKSRKRAVEYV